MRIFHQKHILRYDFAGFQSFIGKNETPWHIDEVSAGASMRLSSCF